MKRVAPVIDLPLDELLERWTIPEPNTGCYLWLGATQSDGYGYAKFGTPGTWKGAHRHVWQLAAGRPIPEGMVVRHKCDNPPCVNPDHLEIGTKADNTRDVHRRGRYNLKGRLQRAALLSDAAAQEAIRVAFFRDHVSDWVLAKQHKVTCGTIGRILSTGGFGRNQRLYGRP